MGGSIFRTKDEISETKDYNIYTKWRWKLFVAFFALIFLVLMFSSRHTNNPAMLYGEWVTLNRSSTTSEFRPAPARERSWLLSSQTRYTFNPDGTGVVAADYLPQEFTWYTEGNLLKITYENSEVVLEFLIIRHWFRFGPLGYTELMLAYSGPLRLEYPSEYWEISYYVRPEILSQMRQLR